MIIIIKTRLNPNDNNINSIGLYRIFVGLIDAIKNNPGIKKNRIKANELIYVFYNIVINIIDIIKRK